MMTKQRKIAAPVANVETQAYWDAANAADRPKRALPFGLGRNRAILRPCRLHGPPAHAARQDLELIPIAPQRGIK